VPVIFPWFGPRQGAPSDPAHGFARLREWILESVEQTADDAIAIILRLEADDATRAIWPGEFALRYHVGIGAALTLMLDVCNGSDKAIRFEEALHTYLAVSDARNITVEGLAGAAYLDKMDGFQRKQQGTDPIHIIGETDRIYLNTQSTCVVNDPGAERRIVIEKNGSDATVLWNPWIAKAKAMSDFGDDEWPNMLCIETCNVAEHAVTLAAGQTHRMQAMIRAENR